MHAWSCMKICHFTDAFQKKNLHFTWLTMIDAEIVFFSARWYKARPWLCWATFICPNKWHLPIDHGKSRQRWAAGPHSFTCIWLNWKFWDTFWWYYRWYQIAHESVAENFCVNLQLGRSRILDAESKELKGSRAKKLSKNSGRTRRPSPHSCRESPHLWLR